MPTSEILRDALAKVVASTRPEPHEGHKAALIRKLEENIEYFAAQEAKERSIVEEHIRETGHVRIEATMLGPRCLECAEKAPAPGRRSVRRSRGSA